MSPRDVIDLGPGTLGWGRVRQMVAYPCLAEPDEIQALTQFGDLKISHEPGSFTLLVILMLGFRMIRKSGQWFIFSVHV